MLSTPGRYAVAFVLRGADVDPVLVTWQLGLQPTFSAPPIRSLRSRDGTKYRAHFDGIWAFSTARYVDMPDVRAHLAYLLEQLLPHADRLRELAATGRAHVDVPYDAALGQTPSLDQALTRMIGQIGAEIHFAPVYFR